MLTAEDVDLLREKIEYIRADHVEEDEEAPACPCSCAGVAVGAAVALVLLAVVCLALAMAFLESSREWALAAVSTYFYTCVHGCCTCSC